MSSSTNTGCEARSIGYPLPLDENVDDKSKIKHSEQASFKQASFKQASFKQASFKQASFKHSAMNEQASAMSEREVTHEQELVTHTGFEALSGCITHVIEYGVTRENEGRPGVMEDRSRQSHTGLEAQCPRIYGAVLTKFQENTKRPKLPKLPTVWR